MRRKSVEKKITGIIPPLLTAFDTKGEYDAVAQKAIVDYLVGQVQGFYICGTYGSGPMMTSEERKRVTEDVLKFVNGRIPVISHVGGCATRAVVDLARHSEKAGATAVAAVPPTYYGFGEDSVLRHFKELRAAVSIPVFVYNNPKTTGVSVTPKMLAKLADLGIDGVKDSSFDILVFWGQMWAVNKPGFIPVIGTEALILPAVGLGAHAAVCGLANAIPEPVVELFNAVKKGNLAEAGPLQEKVSKMRDIMHLAPTLPMIQAVLRARGVNGGYPRLPFVLPDDELVNRAMNEFRALGVKV
jgi:dihydrodipicolinate synthase/N-acetylneuraminate lyase